MAKKVKKATTPKVKAPPKAPPMTVQIVKSQAHFYKHKLPRVAEYAEKALGTYFLSFEVTAGPDALYIPISIATGRKSAGFLYQIEGSAVGVPTAVIQEKGGKDITTVTSGTIVYTKIPPLKTASYILNAEIVGDIGKTYRILVNTISYKTNPNDFRYKKFHTELGTESLVFRSALK